MPSQGQGRNIKFYVGSTTTVELDKLHLRSTEDADGIPSAYLANATVIVEEFKDTAGVNVTGVTLPVTMSYVASSNGKYRGDLSAAAVLTVGSEYRCLVKATAAVTGEILRVKLQGPAVYAGG